ncbi:MAG: DEAD/DEAH box helicase family protein [Candidatus Caldarchaeum sp.]
MIGLRPAVDRWREENYPGVTETTRRLLTFWFQEDHLLPDGRNFSYYFGQREAIETLVYCYEVMKARSLYKLVQDFCPPDEYIPVDPRFDNFPRYTFKMATGSGKTKVMSLAIVWSYFNALKEKDSPLARNFLILAPNIIVFERLREDFEDGKIFRQDPLIPPEWRHEWDVKVVLQDQPEAGATTGTIYLTNIQRLYEREEQPPATPVEVLLGRSPRRETEVSGEELLERIRKYPDLMVINDEAHHVWDEELAWSRTIQDIHDHLRVHYGTGLVAQLDFSATPKDQRGAFFPWIIVDYPIAQAIEDGIVKRPIIGKVVEAREMAASRADVRYRHWIDAGVTRWREYQEKLQPSGRKPVLFIMGEDTRAADEIYEYLESLPELTGKVLLIHTDNRGEVTKRDLEKAREAARKVDKPENPYHAIVSVLMLREGWDVKNVTVIVGLRPYSARANILPEQTIGRGLRLMEGPGSGLEETVDVIGNQAFEDFVRQLEKEDVTFGEVDLRRDRVNKEPYIFPEEKRLQYDLSIPKLSAHLNWTPISLSDLDMEKIRRITLDLPEYKDSDLKHYIGYDALTQAKVLEREWELPIPENGEAVVAYFTQLVLRNAHLPGRFAELAPKLREYIETILFGTKVDIDDKRVLRRLNMPDAREIIVDVFTKAINNLTIQPQQEIFLREELKLSSTRAFPWKRPVVKATKTVFNLVACDNHYEAEFAVFLDNAPDVVAFAKLTQYVPFWIEYVDQQGAFRLYYPDFVVKTTKGEMFLVETKGREDIDVISKDKRAKKWCCDATKLTHIQWHYLKAMQDVFERYMPSNLEELYQLYLME